MLKRTPCIGICSTTYGDLVCRGCKRFAHEIVQWNGFDDSQRDAVWQRLLTIRRGAVRDFVELLDPEKLAEGARQLGIADADAQDPVDLVYEVLRRVQRRGAELSVLGFVVHPQQPVDTAAEDAAYTLLQHIDREFHQRSMAHYERSFRTLAQ